MSISGTSIAATIVGSAGKSAVAGRNCSAAGRGSGRTATTAAITTATSAITGATEPFEIPAGVIAGRGFFIAGS